MDPREQGDGERGMPNSQTQSQNENKKAISSKQNPQTALDGLRSDSKARSSDTLQLRTKSLKDLSNANIVTGSSSNLSTEIHSPGAGSRSGTASASASVSRSSSVQGSQRIKEGNRPKIDSILEEARNRKVAMNSGRRDSEEAACPGKGGGVDESLDLGNGGNGFGNEYANGREGRGESSMDEETSVLRQGPDVNYGGVGVGTGTSGNMNNGNNNVKRKLGISNKDRRGGILGTGRGRGFQGTEAGRDGHNDGVMNTYENGEDEDGERPSGRIPKWWKRMMEEYGSIELENKGSVARDHLALERTFLAWLRTSLAFASIGIAITQLFRLNSSSSTTPPNPDDSQNHLRHLGKPLGATFVGISILMLSVGFHRYFEGQFYIIRGKFPASRGSIALVAAITGLLMVTSLVVVVVGNRGGWER